MYCSFFGHNYEVKKKVTHHVKEYQCSHCKQKVTTNGKGQLTLLTPMYEEINTVLERIHLNRVKRQQLMLDR